MRMTDRLLWAIGGTWGDGRQDDPPAPEAFKHDGEDEARLPNEYDTPEGVYRSSELDRVESDDNGRTRVFACGMCGQDYVAMRKSRRSRCMACGRKVHNAAQRARNARRAAAREAKG